MPETQVRAWYQKKRYVLTGAVVGLAMFFGGADTGSTTPTSNLAPPGALVEPTGTPVASTTPDVRTTTTAAETSRAEDSSKATTKGNIPVAERSSIVTDQTTPPATRSTQGTTATAPSYTPQETVPLSNDDHYTNSKGNTVHSPAYAPTVPAGASAQCRDGTYSFSQSRRGTCSHHGGVATWL